MKCLKCGGSTKKKTGSVYGQPSQTTEYEECGNCGLVSKTSVKGVRVFDEHDGEFKKSESKKIVTGS
jgi:hypothetical protein